jgi:hypothetical protein
MVSFRRAVVTIYFAGNAMFVASKLCVVAIWPAAEVSLAAPNETKFASKRSRQNRKRTAPKFDNVGVPGCIQALECAGDVPVADQQCHQSKRFV